MGVWSHVWFPEGILESISCFRILEVNVFLDIAIKRYRDIYIESIPNIFQGRDIRISGGNIGNEFDQKVPLTSNLTFFNPIRSAQENTWCGFGFNKDMAQMDGSVSWSFYWATQ